MKTSNTQTAPAKLRKKKIEKQKSIQLESAIKSDIQWGLFSKEN